MPRRLLRLAGDARLVEHVRRGNDAAFEVLFERHGPAVLGFCRHMLSSPEEAEDAVQHTFAAAYRDLRRGGDRELALKPWLFTIARNRCLSVLRARREVPAGADELESGAPPGAGLAEQAEQRADLRHLLADVRELPDEQRAALLLTELGDLSHAEVAGVLDCEVSRVKGLVFRARSALIARREARETPCANIREQLANLRGGALRRTELRLHLRECPGCRSYRERVRQQRRMLAAALPVAPTLGLKSSVLAAVGIGGGSAGGLAAAGSVGGATVAKVAVAGVLAGGGLAAGEAVVNSEREAIGPAAPSHTSDGEASPASSREASGSAPRAAEARGGAPVGAESKQGQDPDRITRRRGRGPIQAPPASTPVRRGPPDKPWKPERGPTAEPQGLAKGHAKPAPGSRGRGNAGSPAAKVKPKEVPRAEVPRANGSPNGNGPKVNKGPKGNSGSKATGGPQADGAPKPGAEVKANGAPKKNVNPRRGGMANGTPKPGDLPKAPAAPKAKTDAAPPPVAKPEPPGKTP